MASALLLLAGGVYADQGGDSSLEYLVRPGDTLWDIAEKYYGDPETWPSIGDANSVTIPKHLQPGAVLKVTPQQSFPGRVEHLTGNVWLLGDTPRRALSIGDLVSVGTLLEVDSGAFLTLQFGDGARIVLPSNTRVRLDEGEGGLGVEVALLEGGVESRVPKNRASMQRFNVVTPSGNLGVRGTHFRVAYRNDASTTTSVLEGVVDASFGTHQADLNAGRGVWASSDGGFNVVDLLPPPGLLSSGAGEGDALELALTSVAGASNYRAQLATDPDFLNIVRDETSVDGNFRFQALDGGFYHVRLTARDSHNIESLSQRELLFHRPAGVGVEYHQGEWIFHWDRHPRASYQLQLSTDPDFTSLIVDQSLQDATGSRISRLEPHTYYWRLLVAPEGAGSSHLAGSGKLNAEARN